MQIYDGVWVVHLAGCRRGEHVGILGMLAMFRYQQVDSLLWNTDFSDRSLRFGAGECQFAIGILYILFAHGDGFVLDVEVAPQESSQFTLAYGGILSRKKRSAQKKIITTSKLVV